MTSLGKAGSASTLTEVNASANDATTSEVTSTCTVRCTQVILESQNLGWRLVCHCQENPRIGKTREGGWEQQIPSRLAFVPPVLFVFTFVWGCHTESPANSLLEVSRVSLQLTAVSGTTHYQFWGWCPFKLLWIFDRPYTTDLRHVMLERDSLKEMSSINVPSNTMRATSSKMNNQHRVWTAMTMNIELPECVPQSS